jgi:hypothetical protein
MCGVSLIAGRSGGKHYRLRRMERGLWGGDSEQKKKGFSSNFYNRYVIVVYTGLRSDSIKNP